MHTEVDTFQEQETELQSERENPVDWVRQELLLVEKWNAQICRATTVSGKTPIFLIFNKPESETHIFSP